MPLPEIKVGDLSVDKLPKLCQRRWLVREEIALPCSIFLHADRATSDATVNPILGKIQYFRQLRDSQVAGHSARVRIIRTLKDAVGQTNLVDRIDE